MLRAEEIERGLVLRLDPDILHATGARTERRPGLHVQGVHYFVCCSRVPGVSLWVPAFSNPIVGRIKVGWKAGDPAWIGRDSYVDLTQIWVAPDIAVTSAARGVDRTQRGYRNRASTAFLMADRDRDSGPPSGAAPASAPAGDPCTHRASDGAIGHVYQ